MDGERERERERERGRVVVVVVWPPEVEWEEGKACAWYM